MSKWDRGQVAELKHMDMPKSPTITLECLYGKHQAEILHRGTAYCRSCYDKRNLTNELVN